LDGVAATASTMSAAVGCVSRFGCAATGDVLGVEAVESSSAVAPAESVGTLGTSCVSTGAVTALAADVTGVSTDAGLSATAVAAAVTVSGISASAGAATTRKAEAAAARKLKRRPRVQRRLRPGGVRWVKVSTISTDCREYPIFVQIHPHF
jgi:hypothetical protein